MTPYLLISILAYFVGSISFAVIFSRKLAGFDVRDKGSKGAGTTNVLRSVGKKAAIITLICDILKGVVSILLAIMIGNLYGMNSVEVLLLKYLAGFFAIVRTYISNIL
jgi:glycerol-3-phosphate acyltransferase PlsY